MLELRNVSKIYRSKKGPDTIALKNVHLQFASKGMVFILRKSGCGKSTLLNILGGLDTPSSGEIFFCQKNVTQFSNQEYDEYRNSAIGFVFQDFNLLEEYNVFENVSLALELHGKKDSNRVYSLLKKMSIDELVLRKINELSGGQKQRVAIARALVKEPEIILADEPTGNLDYASSQQIFEILKEISQEKLVIVVSHDEESAKRYGERIIKLVDGEVVEDSNPNIQIENKNFSFESSKLPFVFAIKMALRNLQVKPFKLFLTIFIMALSLLFLGVSMNLFLFNDDAFVLKALTDNKQFVLDIYKYEGESSVDLTDTDLKNLETLSGGVLNLAYTLSLGIHSLSFSFEETYGVKDDFYPITPSGKYFVEIEDDALFSNLLGHIPSNNDEIVIHRYMADYILKYGIKDTNGEIYRPKNYEELIEGNHSIKLGNTNIFIVGIVLDDISLYEKYLLSGHFPNENLESFYYTNYASKGNVVYVKDIEYFKNLFYSEENVANSLSLQVGDTFSQDIDVFSSSQIITLNGLEEISSLHKDEVVLSADFLREIDSGFNENYKNLQDDLPSLIEYIQNYLVDGFSLPLILRRPFSENSLFIVQVKGITFDSVNYVSDSVVLEARENIHTPSFVRIVEESPSKLKQLFENTEFVISNSYPSAYYLVDTSFDMVPSVIHLYYFLRYFLLCLALLFVVFTILLFGNYLTTSISSAKKEIGILRALGTSEKDVIKIFLYETGIISFLSYLLFVVFYFLVSFIINHSVNQYLYYSIQVFLENPLVLILVLLFTLALLLMLTSLSLKKITRIKPIDAILDK